MIENIALIGLAISMFTLATIITRPKKVLADWLLCTWLVVLCFAMLRALNSKIQIAGFDLWNLYNPTFNLLHGPLLYFYVRLLTQVRPAFTRADVFHLAPFAVLYLLSLPLELSRQMTPMRPQSSGVIEHSSNIFNAGVETLLLQFGLLNVVSFLIYSGVVVWLLVRHQHKIASYFSRNDVQISLVWIYSLPATFLVITVLNLLNQSGLMPLPQVSPLLLHIVSHCGLVILLCFFGVRQKPVFQVEKSFAKAQDNASMAAVDTISGINKVDSLQSLNRQRLEQEEVEVFKALIHQYMLEEKPFLNPDFSVYLLTQALEIPRHTLSFVLNSGFGKNFYQFVSGYRLEEMKARLSDVNNKETVLDIAISCGFSSKSTYNTLFKKQCGCTPTQFRKSIRAV